ncbi:putative proteasome subunit alpha type-5 [Venturia nashicola]|uniref:Putative proteasome subunit alpha type-5 n=1 Tax=Venturia nashicola TaxID=86259 RepID=A0A4Z1P6R7_9PEZI|nr:putative proteasome subunit alpha type-5 [Venturia nashicola]TLD32013.1 putative proteasome subunit alpha type-5 [Venturia nashicola]
MDTPKRDGPIDQYDIFDSSPQRPLNLYGSALLNDSVDALVSQDGIINSSQKRRFPPSSPTRSPARSPYDNNIQHGSKRCRKSRNPRKSNNSGNNGSVSPRHASTPGRSSRFLEASMRDRPSNKPPSAFTRHFNAHLEDASVDQLMDDYHETEKPLPERPPPRRFDTTSTTKSPQRTNQQNLSTWSSSTGGSNGTEQELSTPKGSGLFRFGKSMASAFNPVSIWKKVATTFQDTKEEMVQEKMQENMQAKMDERYGDSREKAAQAYAALKAAGKLGMQGSTPISRHVRVHAPGYISDVDPQNQRDSGISMGDESRSSMDAGKLAPAMDSTRKASWHSRTPSFQNLKKIASISNLHKRSISGTQSISPDKELNEGLGSLRRSSSKLELKKQHKLSKRVSDLEAKLSAARRELDGALAVPTGSTRSRSVTPIHPLPQVPNEDVDIHHGASHSARYGGGWQRRYNPALPTLLSERLLSADGVMVDDSNASRPQIGSSRDNTLDAIESEVNEAPIRGITEGRFYIQPNESLQPTFTFAAAKNDVLQPMEIDELQPITPKEPISFLADPSSRPQKMEIHIPPPVPEKPTPRKKVVIKRKKVDATYRPSRQEFEEDSHVEEEKPKNLKKKQASVESSPTNKKQRASRVPISTSPNSKKPKLLSKAQPALQVQKVVEQIQVQVLDEEIQPRVSLETVHEHEEITTTTTVTVKDAPSRPTARATPAHPSRARFDRSRSRSRSRSPRKTFGSSTPSGLNSRERRSASPALSNESPVVTARPNGRDVPPMPTMGKLEKKESFEWPDDVF